MWAITVEVRGYAVTVRARKPIKQLSPEQGKIMLSESQFARQESPISEREFSIFDFYSIENEIQFIQEMEDLPDQEKRFYLRENVMRFLGEFVGKVPYTKISFRLKPDGLEYAGFKTSRSYKKALYLGSQREADEWVGYQQVEKQLLDGRAGVTWISPPKYWDYSFVFHFQRVHVPESEKEDEHVRVDEYILRYDETRNTVSESQILLHAFYPDLDFSNSSVFLRNPLSSTQPEFDLNTLMNALGIGFEEIKKSQLFEKKVGKKLGARIEEYIDAIFNEDGDIAREYLIGLFNAAREIKLELDSQSLERSAASISDEKSFSFEQFVAFSNQKTTVVGGGSCPVTRAGNSTPLSGYNIVEGLKMGLTVGDILGKNTCPECSGNNPDNHYHCPQCNKKYSDETHRSQDQRTKDCSCGFKFNC